MSRKSRIDWELYKTQLLELKMQGKSLTDIAAVLYEKLQVNYTAARLSQVFVKWAREQKQLITEEIEQDANRGN